MGQYYKPISITKKQYVNSHDYDNGLKLMEHSYLGNEFMNIVESLIAPGGMWYMTSIVWAGDYADGEPTENEDENENLYHITTDKIKPEQKPEPISYRYIINHTLKKYIDKCKIQPDREGYKIHPLSLLTAEGNGRGNGDYQGTNMEYIGKWARHVITVDNVVPEGYKEVNISFVENYA